MVITITTTAKAPTPETTPGFVSKFEETKDTSVWCRQLKEQGFTHYLTLKTGRITVGDISHEFRILIAAAFFKGEPAEFERLKENAGLTEIPVLEQRKFYSDMMGIGRGDFVGTLAGTELAEWLTFFEAEPSTIREINNLI